MSREPEGGRETPVTKEDVQQALQTAYEELTERVCGLLERRYGRSAAVRRLISDPGSMRLRLVLQARGEPAVCFTAEEDGQGEIRETYVRALCLSELTARIEADLPGTAANAAFPEDSAPETDAGLTLPAYLRGHGVRRILVRLIAAEGAAPERDAVLAAIQQLSRELGVDIAVHYFVLPGEGFPQCREQFRELPSVSSAAIRRHRPVGRFSALVENGAVRASEVN